MKIEKHAISIAEKAIHRLIEYLLEIFLVCKSTNEAIQTLKEQRQALDDNNPEYAADREDKRESMKMSWRLVIIILSIGVDFLLSIQAISILTDKFDLPSILKWVVPTFLIVTEIGISYFQILHQRDGGKGSWVVRNVQYFVLVILAAFSILVIVFTAQTYDASIDNISFIAFITGTIALQIALLVGSIMLHLWLIRNAEAVAEASAYFHYIIARRKLTKKIEKLEHKNKTANLPAFTKDTYKLVQAVEFFKTRFPYATANFEKTIPIELIRAINIIMGRNVFAVDTGEIPSHSK